MNDQPPHGRRTQIIATLGPASSDPETIEALAAAGMDLARINFSHASHEEARATVERVRTAGAGGGRAIAILGDLQGPKLRLGDLDEPLELAEGSTLVLAGEPGHRGPEVVSVAEEVVAARPEPGTRIWLQDGTVELEVKDRSGVRLETVVRTGGPVTSRAGLSLPGVDFDLPALTPEDREDLGEAVRLGMEWLALSFVTRARDLDEARKALSAADAPGVRLVAKIERRAALDDLDAIAGASDALMVARGDLGVEVGVELVPIWQHRIIAAGSTRGLPVIVATEMLESMRTSERPTRAEASDVAHAVWDGAAALMLSAETAIGDHPVEAVAAMDRIVRSAEANPPAPADHRGR